MFNSPLTPREQEVLLLVAEGLSDPEIGRKIYVTANTVKSHLKSISLKLDSRSRAHAVAIAIRTGRIA